MFSYESMQQTNDIDKKLPWVEKYRPKYIDQIVSHQHIIQSLKRFINMRTLPHLLFFGPSGSGKTSTIRCCAYEIYKEYTDCMVLHLNASNERGIETVRTKIKNFVSNNSGIFLPQKDRKIFKLVILDEIDSMTVEAQGMLRQTIEGNSFSTRFCLICNNIEKINIALQSRCTLYQFAPINEKDMKNRLSEIAKLENIQLKKDGINAIAKISKGDLRCAINNLQRIGLTINGMVKESDIYKLSGYSAPIVSKNIFGILLNVYHGEYKIDDAVKEIISIVIDNNVSMFDLLEELKNHVINSTFSVAQKIEIIEEFSNSEIYDSVNVDSDNIIMIIVSTFMLLKK